jgi:hypothetical protein
LAAPEKAAAGDRRVNVAIIGIGNKALFLAINVVNFCTADVWICLG